MIVGKRVYLHNSLAQFGNLDSHLKICHPKRKGLAPNHHFQGRWLLVSGSVLSNSLVPYPYALPSAVVVLEWILDA